MQGLVNIGHIMSQQNNGDWLGDLPFILFRDSSLQDLNAVRNHMDDVPSAATGLAFGIFLHPYDGDVCVVKPMMRRHR